MIRISAHKCVPDLDMFMSMVSSCVNQPVEELLNWLIFSVSTITASGTKVVWDLDELARFVIGKLPENVSADLSRHPHRAKFGNYRLFYIPEKVFGVHKNGSEALFYDLSQYFPGEREPGSLTEMQEKADLLQETLSELGIDDPPSLASPLACFRGHELLSTLDGAFPSIFDLGDEWLDAQELALQCTPREWISNYQIGFFENLYKYDLSSAYPNAAARLPNLRDCRLEKADGVDLNADMGFFVGDFTVFPDHPFAFCSPFLVDRGDGALINFVGTKRDYRCTLDDIVCLYYHGMGKFHLRSGWLVYWDGSADDPTSEYTYLPFYHLMHRLFDMRGASPLRSYLLKRVMNGIIGQLLETRKDGNGCVVEYGKHYNPIYHAMITNPVRLEVFDELVRQQVTKSDLVHVGVDGFRSTKQTATVPSGVAPMGQWRRAGQESAFVLSPGAIVSNDGRRFKRTDYHDLLAECEARPNAYLLGEDPEDRINVRHLFLRQIRSFPKMPRNARDLKGTFGSEPVNLDG